MATLGIRDAFDLANPRLGVAVVMSALPLLIPLVIILMRRLKNYGGAAVSTITADTGPARSATRPAERMQRAARRWRYASNVGAAILSVVLLVWTLAPLYNMVMVAFEAEGDVFSDHLWPPNASGQQLLDRPDPGLLVSGVFLAPVRQQRLSSA